MHLLVLCWPCLRAREREGPQSMEEGRAQQMWRALTGAPRGLGAHSCRECPRAASPGLMRPAPGLWLGVPTLGMRESGGGWCLSRDSPSKQKGHPQGET